MMVPYEYSSSDNNESLDIDIDSDLDIHSNNHFGNAKSPTKNDMIEKHTKNKLTRTLPCCGIVNDTTV